MVSSEFKQHATVLVKGLERKREWAVGLTTLTAAATANATLGIRGGRLRSRVAGTISHTAVEATIAALKGFSKTPRTVTKRQMQAAVKLAEQAKALLSSKVVKARNVDAYLRNVITTTKLRGRDPITLGPKADVVQQKHLELYAMMYMTVAWGPWSTLLGLGVERTIAREQMITAFEGIPHTVAVLCRQSFPDNADAHLVAQAMSKGVQEKLNNAQLSGGFLGSAWAVVSPILMPMMITSALDGSILSWLWGLATTIGNAGLSFMTGSSIFGVAGVALSGWAALWLLCTLIKWIVCRWFTTSKEEHQRRAKETTDRTMSAQMFQAYADLI